MSDSTPRFEGSAGTGPAPVATMPTDSAPEHPPETTSQPPRGRPLSEEENLRYRAVNSLLSSLRL